MPLSECNGDNNDEMQVSLLKAWDGGPQAFSAPSKLGFLIETLWQLIIQYFGFYNFFALILAVSIKTALCFIGNLFKSSADDANVLFVA